MGRSAVVLLLTLVLGAFAAAHAEDYDKSVAYPEDEKNEKRCSMGKPLRYSTYGCPTCKRDDKCVKTKCSDYDGKADVTIDLKCLFGGKIGFVAVSYKDGKDYKCVNNQKGYSYDKKIVLSGLKCKDLSEKVELRFVVQNKWWYNPHGKDLEVSDSCYDKCTHGKPCHTCEFKEIYIPKCENYDCKKPMCDYKNKHECPKEMDKCFEYEQYEHYVKVTMKKDCHKKMKHVACSYKDYEEEEDKSMDHKYSDKDYTFSFKAACKSKFKWYSEDDYFVNKDAPTYPSHDDDKCYKYFEHGKVCDQCGPYEVYVPDCKKD
jgi:hypothetical protein